MTARLSLPDVTLVCIDNVAIDLMHMSLRDCAQKVDFCCVSIQSPSVGGMTYSETLQHVIPLCISTSHALIVQYDSWILDETRWNPEWLEYDYIGAPWPWYTDGLNVGNGGFCLRSKRLMEFLRTNANEYPLTDPEDNTLCRHYRPALEALGFRWAPLDVAHEFAFERETPHPAFGFHGIFNWPHVL